ncbi:hypothetical protein Sliba_48700 [Streptomyces nigrescens]|uniref:Uncharacterized protein n=1 Tax=Streptomyces nigrescens TaxID=1920 RepID=A0A640TLC8_STRNI|nr:hypothetical protein Sliba_48700 [Streptomyces libani subsp. libani]GGV94290.1 hypothetical protein GCM10010500_31640 [Streptomyces libani subsp. libani]
MGCFAAYLLLWVLRCLPLGFFPAAHPLRLVFPRRPPPFGGWAGVCGSVCGEWRVRGGVGRDGAGRGGIVPWIGGGSGSVGAVSAQRFGVARGWVAGRCE